MTFKINEKIIRSALVNGDFTVTPMDEVHTARIVKSNGTAKEIVAAELKVDPEKLMIMDIKAAPAYYEIADEIFFEHAHPCNAPRKPRKKTEEAAQ